MLEGQNKVAVMFFFQHVQALLHEIVAGYRGGDIQNACLKDEVARE